MKKQLLLLALSLPLLYAHAQLEKGKWMIDLQFEGNNSAYNSSVQDPTGLTNTSSVTNDNIALKLGLTKLISKNYFIGFGIQYRGIWGKDFANFVNNPSLNRDFNFHDKYFGGFFQIGKIREISKKFYYSYSVTIGINGVDRSATDRGIQIYSNVMPIEFNYLFKNRFLLRINLFQFNYSYQDLTNKSNINPTAPGKNYFTDISYSLNPFRNAITISYLLNHKK